MALAACLTGCGGGEKSLEGSLAQVLELSYTRAELVVGTGDVVLRFARPYGTGEDTVLKVTVLTEGMQLSAPSPIDLGEVLSAGNPRATVTRHVYDEPDHRVLPPVARGQLSLRQAPIPGSRVDGQLSVTFAQGSELGAGRTVHGEFDAEVAP